ncbi:MAG: YybS family protein [Deltaproteobacteria bacterium]|nr:YybS family protein [Deltaproteobacteria bacterium]MBW1918891.1 YybS family protein [Deltaproteobacteria bacterium]MBW1934675.1 YybS family protein [Deltaproteobacteria bacterium]MBW1976951.1 YybS family protein [Deltaproteobacteria bacterium]MBW2043535.1 YybS family protein [Deltaproteobacteria bacterium]
MKTTDLIGCVGTATALLLISSLIPFVGPFLSFLVPLPFLYFATKFGFLEGAKTLALSLVVVGLIGHLLKYPQLLFLCLEFGIMGLIISYLYHLKLSIGRTITLGTGLMLLVGFVMLSVLGFTRNMGPIELLLNYVSNTLSDTAKIYGNMAANQDKTVELQQYAKALISIVRKTYPALTILGTGLIVWLNVVLSKPLFLAGKLQYPDFGFLDQWRSPEPMVWVVIVAGFSLFLPVGGIRWVSVNVFIVFMTVYAFHGLSIVLFFLNKYRAPAWIRFAVYFLIFFQQIFLLVLALAGLFDQWVDFRRIHQRKAVS